MQIICVLVYSLFPFFLSLPLCLAPSAFILIHFFTQSSLCFLKTCLYHSNLFWCTTFTVFYSQPLSIKSRNVSSSIHECEAKIYVLCISCINFVCCVYSKITVSVKIASCALELPVCAMSQHHWNTSFRHHWLLVARLTVTVSDGL